MLKFTSYTPISAIILWWEKYRRRADCWVSSMSFPLWFLSQLLIDFYSYYVYNFCPNLYLLLMYDSWGSYICILQSVLALSLSMERLTFQYLSVSFVRTCRLDHFILLSIWRWVLFGWYSLENSPHFLWRVRDTYFYRILFVGIGASLLKLGLSFYWVFCLLFFWRY